MSTKKVHSAALLPPLTRCAHFHKCRRARLLQSVADDARRELGEDDEISVSARSGLAYGLQQADRHPESIVTYQKVLDDHVRIYGPDHEEARWSRSTLASACYAAGRLGEAVHSSAKY
jgi:hypothetical protein